MSIEVESMEAMVQRLYGCGGGEQAKAVVKAIKAINAAQGMLDAENRVTALFHLSAALGGQSRAVDTIRLAAELLGGGD